MDITCASAYETCSMYVLRVALGFVGVCLRVETHCVSMIARVNYSLKLQHICELLITIMSYLCEPYQHHKKLCSDLTRAAASQQDLIPCRCHIFVEHIVCARRSPSAAC